MVKIEASTIPETYEALMLKMNENGRIILNHDEKTMDVCSVAEIHNSFGEPRIHKCFLGGIADLEVYTQEVVYGIHDHWIDSSPTAWKYTYHRRLRNYSALTIGKGGIDQLESVVYNLTQNPEGRRAQAIIWEPFRDALSIEPPCLQRLWYRIVNDKLDMHACWRSRDLMGAWFMNVYALTELQRVIAEQISEKMNKHITVGKYVEFCDSLHVYSKDLERFFAEIEKIRLEPIENRVMRCDSDIVQEIINETRRGLA